MKNHLLLFAFIITSVISFANIKVNVTIKNNTAIEFTEAKLLVYKSNKVIHSVTIESLSDFTLNLSKSGKYYFAIESKAFIGQIDYPKRITNNNTITINLFEKRKTIVANNPLLGLGKSNDTEVNSQDIELGITNGTAFFIIQGIDNTIPQDYIDFKKKYGIGAFKDNCVIDPISYKTAVENNRVISNYLNNKYGTAWLNELKHKPIGL